MERMEFRQWSFLSDREATLQAYRSMAPGRGCSDDCGCAPCRNFAAQKNGIYPPEVIDLFGRLGIDYTQEIEVCHVTKLEEGHFYNGWFHFVGTGLAAKEFKARELISPGFEAFLTSKCGILGFEPFRELPTLQFEFFVTLPWVIDNPEPES